MTVNHEKATTIIQNKQINFRLSATQLEKLTFSAHQVGLSPSKYAKQRALDSPLVEPKISADQVAQIHFQLAKIGNNLNQLTRLAHQGYPLELGALTDLKNEVTKVWQRLS